MTLPPITTPPQKFPLPFADRQPQFVPRSIDPKVRLKTYPAWAQDSTVWEVPRWVKALGIVAGFLVLCIGAAIYGALAR